MTSKLLSPILDNEALTRGLADPEARILVEWLVEKAEQLEETTGSVEGACQELSRLCRWARSISRFVGLWCHENDAGAAVQLAATERFAWPLPCPGADPCELMAEILEWEDERIGG
jgi:hypothetical protein